MLESERDRYVNKRTFAFKHHTRFMRSLIMRQDQWANTQLPHLAFYHSLFFTHSKIFFFQFFFLSYFVLTPNHPCFIFFYFFMYIHNYYMNVIRLAKRSCITHLQYICLCWYLFMCTLLMHLSYHQLPEFFLNIILLYHN